MKKCVVKSCIIVGIAFVLGWALSLFSFFTAAAPTTASSSVNLYYEGAADGQDMRGSKFDPNEIISLETVQTALDKLELSEKYDAEAIVRGMSVTGKYPENIVSQITAADSSFGYEGIRSLEAADYYPTVYNVTLSDDFAGMLTKKDLENVLSAVLRVYSERFYERQSRIFAPDASLEALFSYDGHDYSKCIDLLETKIKLMQSFADEQAIGNEQFSKGGLTFADISAKYSALLDNQIEKMKVLVLIKGLSVDAQAMIDEYTYLIEGLDLDLEEKNRALSSVRELVESFERDKILYVTSGSETVKITGDSGATYDRLVESVRLLSEEITSSEVQKQEYLRRIEDIRNALSDPDTFDTLQQSMEEAEKSYLAINQELSSMLSALDKSKAENGLAFTPVVVESRSLLSVSFVKTVIKCMGPLMVIAIVIVLLIFMDREVKKSRRKSKLSK